MKLKFKRLNPFITHIGIECAFVIGGLTRKYLFLEEKIVHSLEIVDLKQKICIYVNFKFTSYSKRVLMVKIKWKVIKLQKFDDFFLDDVLIDEYYK